MLDIKTDWDIYNEGREGKYQCQLDGSVVGRNVNGKDGET